MSLLDSASPKGKAAILSALALTILVIWILLSAGIALAGLGQIQPNLNYAAVPAWFWYYRDDAKIMGWLLGSFGAVGAGAVAAGVAIALRIRPELHGSARFANEMELRREELRSDDGIILGRKNGRYLRFGGPEHVILYAPTRSGKGVGVVIPNLLSWADSVVVLDMKQENFKITGGFRARHGQEVHLFDPLSPTGKTVRYNPLSYIDRGAPIEVVDELQKIASMLFPVAPRADPFWAEASRTGFIGVGGYIAATKGAAFTLGEIFRQLTDGDPKARIKAILEQEKGQRTLSGPVISALSDFTSHSDKTFSGVKGTISARLALFLNPRVDYATSHSDFDLRDLRRRRMSIYLGVSPDNMDRVAPLYNLFFQQLIDLNTRELPGEKDKYQVLMLMDEFARLGRANVIAKGFSYVAGYGIRLLAVIQSPSQLSAEDAYGRDGAEEILTNCGVEIVFTPKELKVAEELSRRLGTYTFGAKSRSRPVGLHKGSHSTSESAQSRALMMPQELMQMSRNDLIVIRGGIPPVRGRKIFYFRDKDFKARLGTDAPEPARDPKAWAAVEARSKPPAPNPLAPEAEAPVAAATAAGPAEQPAPTKESSSPPPVAVAGPGKPIATVEPGPPRVREMTIEEAAGEVPIAVKPGRKAAFLVMAHADTSAVTDAGTALESARALKDALLAHGIKTKPPVAGFAPNAQDEPPIERVVITAAVAAPTNEIAPLSRGKVTEAEIAAAAAFVKKPPTTIRKRAPASAKASTNGDKSPPPKPRASRRLADKSDQPNS